MSTELNCTLDFDSATGQGSNPLTVGDTGALTCRGAVDGANLESARTFDFEKKIPAYELFLLELKETSSEQVTWIVTTYIPGEYRGHKVGILAGDKQFVTSPLDWTVNSVLRPGQQPEPAPSIGPFSLSYPLWFWLTIAVAAAFVGGFIFWFWRRGERRRRLYREIDRHMSMLSAFAQFSKDMRALRRELQGQPPSQKVVEDLERIYRLYLLRELKIPALDFSTGEILVDIKQRHRRIYDSYNSHLRRLFFEFDKARKADSRLSVQDCEQMIQACRQLADKIHAEMRSA